jgi:hypothetical protein
LSSQFIRRYNVDLRTSNLFTICIDIYFYDFLIYFKILSREMTLHRSGFVGYVIRHPDRRYHFDPRRIRVPCTNRSNIYRVTAGARASPITSAECVTAHPGVRLIGRVRDRWSWGSVVGLKTEQLGSVDWWRNWARSTGYYMTLLFIT